MNYELKKIEEADIKKILNDVAYDGFKLRQLQKRPGYFECNPNTSWAIDLDSNSYIFLAPRLNSMSGHREYFFYFEKNVYRLLLTSLKSWVINVEGISSSDLSKSFIGAVEQAMFVHRLMGRGEGHEAALSITVKGE